jgi:hypothetical protein
VLLQSRLTACSVRLCHRAHLVRREPVGPTYTFVMLGSGVRSLLRHHPSESHFRKEGEWIGELGRSARVALGSNRVPLLDGSDTTHFGPGEPRSVGVNVLRKPPIFWTEGSVEKNLNPPFVMA